MNRRLTCQQLYHALAPNLDPEGFRLYRAAQKVTGFQPYEAFPYEDARGMFEALDGHQLMVWLEADAFGAVSWEVVPGTTYERAHLGEVDRNTPAYRRFREAVYTEALRGMGLGKFLERRTPPAKVRGKNRPER